MDFRTQDNSDYNSEDSHTDDEWKPPIEFIDLKTLPSFEIISEKGVSTLDSQSIDT